MEMQWDKMNSLQEVSSYYDSCKFKDNEYGLVTICDKDDATFRADGTDGFIYLCFKTYDGDTFRRIREQANEWELEKIYIEKWDPYFGYSEDRNKKEVSVLEIDSEMILVKDKQFYGVMGVAYDYPDTKLLYALKESFITDPVFFLRHFKYGSSDCDMYRETTFFLQKKDVQ